MRRTEANRNSKQGVAEMRDFVVNYIVTKGRSDFGYIYGYNFENRRKERSISRNISI